MSVTIEELRELTMLGIKYASARADQARELTAAIYNAERNTPGLVEKHNAEVDAATWAMVERFGELARKVLEGEESARAQATPERVKILTERGLTELPENSVVMDDGSDYHCVYQKGARNRWYGDERSYEVGQIPLPVTLLWAPEGEDS